MPTAAAVQTLLNTIIRTIDKRIEFRIQPGTDTTRDVVIVHLSHGAKSTTVEVPGVELAASEGDLARRHQLRGKIKRAIDRMWSDQGPIFSTKLTRVAPEGGSFFRAPMRTGGRGKR